MSWRSQLFVGLLVGIVCWPGASRAQNMYDVGVIPATRACANGASPIVIYMDDEDSGNASSYGGWIGGWSSARGTTIRLCRVDGSMFYPLTVNTVTSATQYAVVKLGTTCPNGSVEFVRHIDNEDDDGSNTLKLGSSGLPITPNVVESSSVDLHFCMFRYGPVTLQDRRYRSPTGASILFPYFGFQYGVFASPSFAYSTGDTGMVVSDDEDSGNGDRYSIPSWIDPTEVYWLIPGYPAVRGPIATYTRFNIAKVMPLP